jgi:hypothetical protein
MRHNNSDKSFFINKFSSFEASANISVALFIALTHFVRKDKKYIKTGIAIS